MRLSWLVLGIASILPAEAQESWTFRGNVALGIGAGSVTSVADYATLVGRPRDRVEELQTLFELSGGVEIQMLDAWTVGIDLSRLSRRLVAARGDGSPEWTFDVSWLSPVLMVRNVVHEEDVIVEAGGGIGLARAEMTEQFGGQGLSTSYTTTGLQVMAQLLALTPFGGNVHGMISVDLRAVFPGDAKSTSGTLPSYGGKTATLDLFAVTLRFGITFQG